MSIFYDLLNNGFYMLKNVKKTCALFLAISYMFSPEIMASRKTPAKVVAGWVEKIVVEKQNFTVKAKLDTGAKTSSIFAQDITLFKKNKKRWVRFTLVLLTDNKVQKKITLEKPRARRVKVKEHNGKHDHRPVVDLEICFNGRVYTTEFTLTDRSAFIYPVLLGRAFLSKRAIIDAEKTFRTLATCH